MCVCMYVCMYINIYHIICNIVLKTKDVPALRFSEHELCFFKAMMENVQNIWVFPMFYGYASKRSGFVCHLLARTFSENVRAQKQ